MRLHDVQFVSTPEQVTQGTVQTKGEGAQVALPFYTNLEAQGHFKFCASNSRFDEFPHEVQLVEIRVHV